MERRHCYALLAGAARYEDPSVTDLPACGRDVSLMRKALREGLLFPDENIRVVGEDGRILLRDLARALQEFAVLLTEEDLLLFYFSGHGNETSLLVTDGALRLDSLADYLRRMRIRNRILILDSCCAGSLVLPERPGFGPGERLGELAGRGCALLASASAGEEAWQEEGASYSLFTEFVSIAMLSRSGRRKGRKPLFAVTEYARTLTEVWNRDHPEHAQHPVFRADMIGSVSFPVEQTHPDTKTDIRLESDHFTLYEVRSVSTASMRRLAAFLTCEEELTEEDVAVYTKEAAEALRMSHAADSLKYRISALQTGYAADSLKYRTSALQTGCAVDSGEKAGLTFLPLRAVWCYFGRDERDMKEGCFAGSGLWTADEEAWERLCPGRNKAAAPCGIFVRMNPSYEMIRGMREEALDRAAFIAETQKHLSDLVSGAEAFIEGLHRVENREANAEELRAALGPWRKKVNAACMALSDMPLPDEGLRMWSDAVQELANRADDMTIVFAEDSPYDESAARRLLQHAAEKYCEAVDAVSEAERKCRIYGDL